MTDRNLDLNFPYSASLCNASAMVGLKLSGDGKGRGRGSSGFLFEWDRNGALATAGSNLIYFAGG